MKYCPNCGAPVAQENKFCHSCGEKVTEQAQPQYQSNYETNAYQNTYSPNPEPVVSKKNAIIAFIFGLINIELVVACIFPYICFLFFPACLVLSIIGIKKASKYVSEAGKPNAFSKIGKILCIISLVLACIFFVVGLVMSLSPEAATEFYEAFFYAYGFNIDDFSGSYTNGGYNGSYNGGGYYTTCFGF